MPITFEEVSADLRPEAVDRAEPAPPRPAEPDKAALRELVDRQWQLREERDARLCDQ